MTKTDVTRRTFLATSAAAIGVASFPTPLIAKERELVIISEKSGDQLPVLENIVNEFGKAAGVKISFNNMDHEAHKTAIRNYLVASPPDINFWFSGERMRGFVNKGLLADISDLVEAENWKDVVPGMGAVTVDGRQYGLPLGGPLWGMWYRRDTFEENGFTVPKTVDDLFTLKQQADDAGMSAIAIGTKNLWPAAGWFDHMNLRINGLEHHMALMEGKIAYTDASMMKVFDAWAEMVNAGMFVDNHTSFAWDQAGALLAQKKAAMMDLGAFIKYAFADEDHDQLEFAAFPTIDPAMPQYEDFSVNSVHIPAGAKNPEVAREFLSYFYAPEVQKPYADSDGSIPARVDVDMSDNRLVAISQDVMRTAAGTAQYYDRDTNPDVAQAGLKGFQEFMVHPERAEKVLGNIERARERIYGAL